MYRFISCCTNGKWQIYIVCKFILIFIFVRFHYIYLSVCISILNVFPLGEKVQFSIEVLPSECLSSLLDNFHLVSNGQNLLKNTFIVFARKFMALLIHFRLFLVFYLEIISFQLFKLRLN